MDRRERLEGPGALEEALLAAFAGWQAKLWTALPAVIQSFDAAKLTCSAQPTIRAQLRSPDGVWQWVNLPLLVDVPVVFPSGGGYSLTFPIAAGDEVLVVFSSRCLDAWWQLGGVQVQADLRMHDLSDGFAIPGPRSQPRRYTASASTVQLRSDDGATYIELAAGGAINIHGNVTITGTVTANGHRIDETHRHSGVQTGGSNTGTVT